MEGVKTDGTQKGAPPEKLGVVGTVPILLLAALQRKRITD
jgi:hypothetical protein